MPGIRRNVHLGALKTPTTWTYLTSFFNLISGGTTWTPPKRAWYRIYVWGASGNGGDGQTIVTNSDTSTWTGGAAGAGGGSGGFCLSEYILGTSDTCHIYVYNAEYTGSATQFTPGSNPTMYAYPGRAGTGANQGSGFQILPPWAGGSGGSASGGNIFNENGYAGGNGGTGGNTYTMSSSGVYLPSSGWNGGGSGNYQGFGGGGGAQYASVYYNYGGGGGAGGGGAPAGAAYASKYLTRSSQGGAGGGNWGNDGYSGQSLNQFSNSYRYVSGGGGGGGGGGGVGSSMGSMYSYGGAGVNGQYYGVIIIEQGS